MKSIKTKSKSNHNFWSLSSKIFSLIIFPFITNVLMTGLTAFLFICAFAANSSAAESRQIISLKNGFNFAAVTLTPRSNLADILAANRSIKEIYQYSPAAGSFLTVLRINGRPEAIDGTDPGFTAAQSYFINSEALALERDTALFSKKFTALADKNSLAVAKAIVDSYIESPKLFGKSLTMSVIDLSKIDVMAGYINNLASLWLSKILNEAEVKTLVNAIYNSQRFGPAPYNESSTTLLYDFSTSYIDLFDFASILSKNSGAGNLKNCADLILNYKNTLVAHNRSTGSFYPRANGLTIFVPKFSTQWYNNDMTSNYIREQYMFLTEFGRLTKLGAFLDEWAGLLYKMGY